MAEMRVPLLRWLVDPVLAGYSAQDDDDGQRSHGFSVVFVFQLPKKEKPEEDAMEEAEWTRRFIDEAEYKQTRQELMEGVIVDKVVRVGFGRRASISRHANDLRHGSKPRDIE